jgi:hypothetical protein
MGLTTLVLLCTVAVTQYQKHKDLSGLVNDANGPDRSGLDSCATFTPVSQTKRGTAYARTGDNDSVEVIGTPTGDDPWQEVSKLVAAYYQKTGMEYKGTVKVIDDNGDTSKVVEEQPFEYTILNNDNYYYRLAHIEMVNKKNFLLAVDNESKTISISGKVVHRKNARPFDIRDFKKILEKGKAHALVTMSGDEKILTIDNIPDPDIQGYRIWYSPTSYRVHKMLIGMARLSPLDDDKADGQSNDDAAKNNKTNQPPATGSDEINTWYYYLEVSYTQVQPLALSVKDFNPENKFIQVHDRQLTLSPAYKQYQLLNTIEP